MYKRSPPPAFLTFHFRPYLICWWRLRRNVAWPRSCFPTKGATSPPKFAPKALPEELLEWCGTTSQTAMIHLAFFQCKPACVSHARLRCPLHGLHCSMCCCTWSRWKGPPLLARWGSLLQHQNWGPPQNLFPSSELTTWFCNISSAVDFWKCNVGGPATAKCDHQLDHCSGVSGCPTVLFFSPHEKAVMGVGGCEGWTLLFKSNCHGHQIPQGESELTFKMLSHSMQSVLHWPHAFNVCHCWGHQPMEHGPFNEGWSLVSFSCWVNFLAEHTIVESLLEKAIDSAMHCSLLVWIAPATKTQARDPPQALAGCLTFIGAVQFYPLPWWQSFHGTTMTLIETQPHMSHQFNSCGELSKIQNLFCSMVKPSLERSSMLTSFAMDVFSGTNHHFKSFSGASVYL